MVRNLDNDRNTSTTTSHLAAMNTFTRLALSVLFTVSTLRAQPPPKKGTAEKTPAQQLTGVWHEHTPAGEEYATFTADGRLLMKKGYELMTLTYKLDAAAAPWKLVLTTADEPPVILHTVIEMTAAGEFRMARPSGDPAKAPGAGELKKGTSMKRITLEPHEGIHQVVEAHLKGLAGEWEANEGGETVRLTLAADGNWRMISPGWEDKGRFRIDVRKVPCGLDLLSSEGNGPTYSLYDLKPGASLRFGKAGKTPGERPAALGEPGEMQFTRKKP